MKHILRMTALGVGLAGLLAATPEASVGHTSYVTFSKPVALPGVILAAGTYVFDLPAHDLSLVRVSSRDGSTVFLTAFTRIVSWRPEARSNQDVTLGEAPPGQVAQPVLTWYPIARQAGREFVYVE